MQPITGLMAIHHSSTAVLSLCSQSVSRQHLYHVWPSCSAHSHSNFN